MHKITHILVSAFLVTASIGCATENRNLTYAKQEESIDKYISSNFSDESKYIISRCNGSNRITVIPQPEDPQDPQAASAASQTDTVRANSTVTFDYAAYILESTFPPRTLFSTSIEEIAQAAGLWGDDTTFTPVTVNVKTGDLLEGLRRALPGAAQDEECYILFSGKYGFGYLDINKVPKMSPLIYHIWIRKIENE